MSDKDLSKPVAWTDQEEIDDVARGLDGFMFKGGSIEGGDYPIYSREYVQSLLGHIARQEQIMLNQDERLSIRLMELQAKDTRIAELENIVNKPVKLPIKFNLKMGGDKATRTAFKWHNDAIDECAKAVQAHGLVVQGDTTP